MPVTHTIMVDPTRSMKASTDELETALERLGASLDPSSRRRVALLASELVAQVAGRDLGPDVGPVELVVKLEPDVIRLETRGATSASSALHMNGASAGSLAEWGQFLLDRLADRWGLDEDDPATLWAQVARS
jgi:hypothetical protein